MRFVALTFSLFWLVLITVRAQHQNAADISQLMDELIAIQDEDINYEELYENYMQLISSPVNINSAGKEELMLFNILSDRQVSNILRYRQENGEFLSIYELQAIEDLDLATIRKILPFITVEGSVSAMGKGMLRRMVDEKNNYMVTRYQRTLEKSKGYYDAEPTDEKFHGTPHNLYLRFRSSKPQDFSVGFTAEKDAGERMVWNPGKHQYGADYLSYHLQMLNKKKT